MYSVRKMIASSRWNAEQVRRDSYGLARILFASKSANESEWMGLRRFGIQLASTRRKTRCGNLVIRVLVFGLRGSGGRWSSEQNQGASARVRNVPAHSWIVCS